MDQEFTEERSVPPLQAVEWRNRRADVGGKETPMEGMHQVGGAREGFLGRSSRMGVGEFANISPSLS